jgi:hypothetical protein
MRKRLDYILRFLTFALLLFYLALCFATCEGSQKPEEKIQWLEWGE